MPQTHTVPGFKLEPDLFTLAGGPRIGPMGSPRAGNAQDSMGLFSFRKR